MSAAADVGETSTDHDDEGREDARFPARRWRVAAVVAVLACATVHIVIAWSARQPSFPFDEVSTFQMSRMLAGESTPEIRGAGYYPGWAVLLAPLWWLFDDPASFYRAGAALGVLVGQLTIWPLASLGQRLGLARAPSVVAAAIVMAMPARAVQADYLLSERLLVLLAVLATLAAFRLAERPTVGRSLEVVLWLSLGLFTHARFLPVLLAAGVWFVLVAVRHRVVGAVGLVALVVGGRLAQVGGERLNELLLGRPFSQDDPMSDVLDQLTPGLLARSFLGQTWYQAVATFGLVGIGSVLLLALVWRETTRLRAGGATFVLGTALAAVSSSVLRWADAGWLIDASWVRLDVWLYGRYADSVVVIVAMMGVAAVLTATSWRRHLIGLAGVAALCVPVVGWLGPRVPTWGFVTPAHIPGILPFWPLLPESPWPRSDLVRSTLTNDNQLWLVVSIVVVSVLIGLLVLRRHPLTAAVCLLVLVCVASLGADPRSDRFQAREAADLTAVENFRRLESLVDSPTVAFDTGCSRGGSQTAVSQNYLGFYLVPTAMGAQDVSTADPRTDVVISCSDWARATELGARRLDGAAVSGSVFWVLPGPAQDRAATAGLLHSP